MTTTENEVETFEDLTIEETQLFHRNIRMSFGAKEQVYQSLSAYTALSVAEGMPLEWYRDLIAGRPADWECPIAKLPDKPLHIDRAAQEAEDRILAASLIAVEMMSETDRWVCWMADKASRDVAGSIIILWAIDVIAETPDIAASDLRRKVVAELRAEAESFEGWELWLQHLAWIAERREQKAAGEAVRSWKDYITDTPASKATEKGAEVYTAWIKWMAEQAVAKATEHQAETKDDDIAVPLDETDNSIAVPAIIAPV